MKNNEEFKIRVSNNVLNELLLDCYEIKNDDSEYKEYYYKFINYDCMSYSDIDDILSKFDLSNFKYHNLRLNNNALSIMNSCKIVLDLNELYGNDLSNLVIKGLKIKGSFDNFKLGCTIIVDNTDIYGKKIRINPQKIVDKYFAGCHIKDVYFTDSFDGCDIRKTILEKNTNVIINPKNIVDNSLYECKIDGAEFIDSLDGCCIEGLKLKNVENACLHFDRHFYNSVDLSFNSIKIIVENDSQFDLIKESLSLRHKRNKFLGSTIVCNLKQQKELENYNSYIDSAQKIKYEIINSNMDNDILSIFDEELSTGDMKIKEKKKSLFSRFRRS